MLTFGELKYSLLYIFRIFFSML